jgi:hypothetical protein
MPAGNGDGRGNQVRRVAEDLVRQLAEERADAAGEIGRTSCVPVLKNQTGIVRVVCRERDQPNQRRGESATPITSLMRRDRAEPEAGH